MIIRLPKGTRVIDVQDWAASMGCSVTYMRDGSLQFVDHSATPFKPQEPKTTKKKCNVLRFFTGAQA